MKSAEIQMLLVEDDPQDLMLTLRALEKVAPPHRVRVARDGAEALDQIFESLPADGTPHVVLLDLKLPKVDGLEVLRKIRLDARTRTLPVVILTSSREDRDLVESYRLGVNGYVVKPVAFERYTRAVRDLGEFWLGLNEVPATA